MSISLPTIRKSSNCSNRSSGSNRRSVS